MPRFFSILLTLALLPAVLFAQKTTTWSPLKVVPQNTILVNLGGLALDYLNVSYYRSLGSHHALGAYIGYLYHPVGGENLTGYGVGVAYRYYPAGKALARFYYSPIVGLQRGESARAGRDGALGVLLSGVVGWQWYLEERFAVGLGFGGRVILGRSREEDPVVRDAFGASPVITLDLGYGW
jgi:hypothetical protein